MSKKAALSKQIANYLEGNPGKEIYWGEVCREVYGSNSKNKRDLIKKASYGATLILEERGEIVRRVKLGRNLVGLRILTDNEIKEAQQEALDRQEAEKSRATAKDN